MYLSCRNVPTWHSENDNFTLDYVVEVWEWDWERGCLGMGLLGLP